MENLVELLKTFDWTFITIIMGILFFIGAFSFMILRIQKHKSSLLRPQKIANSDLDEITTYDWDVIKSIFLNCALFAGGFYMIGNVIIFLILGAWYTNPLGLGAIAAIFGFHLLQTFDKFYRKMMK